MEANLICPQNWPRVAPSLPAFKYEEITVKKIFVGNLDFKATEESIRALFEQHGTVERVSLMTDRDTGRSRGFAFVEMTDSAEAERAIAALNGFNFGGRALNVNEARPKEARSGPPRSSGSGNTGGGGGRGGHPSGGAE